MSDFNRIPNATEIETIIRDAFPDADDAEFSAMRSNIAEFANDTHVERNVSKDWLRNFIRGDPIAAIAEIKLALDTAKLFNK